MEKASDKAAILAKNIGYQLNDFAKWNGFDLAVDFIVYVMQTSLRCKIYL